MTAITVTRLSSRRVSEARDWRAVYDLCCRTGNNGQPIARERWDFFGRLWIQPYERVCPHWTYVAQAAGAIVGYLTGCPNSREFARAKLRRFTLPLLADILVGRYRGNRDARRFVRHLFHFEETPKQAFPRKLSRLIHRDYPAHLHMNVEADWRGAGVGIKLLEHFFADLRSDRIPGVHLYCGLNPVKFYLGRGFIELGSIQFRGATVHALGRPINQLT